MRQWRVPKISPHHQCLDTNITSNYIPSRIHTHTHAHTHTHIHVHTHTHIHTPCGQQAPQLRPCNQSPYPPTPRCLPKSLQPRPLHERGSWSLSSLSVWVHVIRTCTGMHTFALTLALSLSVKHGYVHTNVHIHTHTHYTRSHTESTLSKTMRGVVILLPAPDVYSGRLSRV